MVSLSLGPAPYPWKSSQVTLNLKQPNQVKGSDQDFSTIPIPILPWDAKGEELPVLL